MATKPERKTVKLQMALHRKPDGTETLLSHDFTAGGSNDYWLTNVGAYMGMVEVLGTYEPIDGDPREKLIEALEAAVEKERADSQVRVNLLVERISKLKCLTHEPAS